MILPQEAAELAAWRINSARARFHHEDFLHVFTPSPRHRFSKRRFATEEIGLGQRLFRLIDVWPFLWLARRCAEAPFPALPLAAAAALSAAELDHQIIPGSHGTTDAPQTSTASTATPAKHAFERRIEEVKSHKSDINALILDYLTMEGYPNAAAKFSKEANLQPQQDCASIRTRQEIQNFIHSGNIQSAIETLNDLDPQILDDDKALHFSLLRLQLVELIRSCNASGGDIAPALKFATEQLGPRAPTNPKFLEDLERTMALLLFPQENLDPQLAALLNPDLRRDAADSVNRAILERQSARREAAIRHLVKMRAWAETKARQAFIVIPDRLDLGLKGEEPDGQSGSLHNAENGHEPMITT
ncbi:hypothetical protein CDD80_7323 [Ophiocordyceps camponoti-rufipedis]|uniref:CTLH domain-containing protein n=1 Tax=Ophiocordyceps camponoti-rufipedis TaxID=2004952 RepID=A0A2C5XR12_9HYPO|nr:hypothetical protein CDD80_7323 [Ophiocordyceps camponoti-rufipedis]